jgi:hypothetical protein
MYRRTILSFALALVAAGAFAAEPRVPSGPLVISERWPRATDLRSWLADVIRIEGLENATETAKGKAFFEWLRLYCRMAVGGMIQAYEGEYGREQYVLDAHKNLFVYGWGYCDTCSRIADAAWKEFTQDPKASDRVVVQNEGGGFHTMYRLRLDGNYGAFDPRYGYYLLDRDTPDARILDWAEVGDDANILKNKDYKHRSRPFFEYFGQEWERALALQPVYYSNQAEWEKAGSPDRSVFGDSHYQIGTKFHDMSFWLPKGTVITRYWDNSARAFYRPVSERANREFPFLPAGRFYRVTESMLNGNWPKYDPNYERMKPYLTTVPAGLGYDPKMEGDKTIGQAWGRLEYGPDLRDPALLQVLTPDSTLIQAKSSPFLRPKDPSNGGFAIFDFYSPYILVEGTLAAKLVGPAKVEIRVLSPKTNQAGDPDVWSPWQPLDVSRPIELGRPRFNGKDVSIHGRYRFQLRVTVPPHSAPAGLDEIALNLLFENGIMSLPRIFEGRNTVRFELRDASLLTAPIRVTYRYQTASGEKVHTQRLNPGDFKSGVARYTLDAPGLIKCNSVSIAYGSN